MLRVQMQISVARKNGPPFHNPAISQSYSIPILSWESASGRVKFNEH